MKTYWRLLAIAFFVVVTDQISKNWILGQLPDGTYWFDGTANKPVTIIEDFFYIVHIQNKGAAWGILEGMGFWLGLLGFVALGAIFFYRKELGLKQKLLQYAFGMMVGGIIGNMIDRFRFEQVVDFLDFHLPIYGRYPAFNIADCGITIGVSLYIINSILEGIRQKNIDANNVKNASAT